MQPQIWVQGLGRRLVQGLAYVLKKTRIRLWEQAKAHGQQMANLAWRCRRPHQEAGSEAAVEE